YPVEGQCRRLTSLPVITERSLRRIMRKRAQVRIGFLHIHALKSTPFSRGQFHSAHAFHEDFSSFALCSLEAEKWNLALSTSDRFLHRDQEFVIALARGIYFQREMVRCHFCRVQRCSGYARDFVSGGQLNFELRRITLHHSHISQGRDAQICFTDRDK